MSITARLALSQLKINRSRTLGALTAIALSTALITAVCSLVASGNALLVGFLGPAYGEYGGAYRRMLLIPGILFGTLILAMSVIVISNVFRVSAGERMAQFGILKCVGATNRQITESVLQEGLMLSAVGIPAGLLTGLALAYAGIGVANYFLEDLNSLVNMMMTQVQLTLAFVLSPAALLLSVALCLSAVVFSAWLPAHRAARISALGCIRGDGSGVLSRGQLRTGPVTERLFGVEGLLAAKSLKRNRRNFRATVIALSVGVVLFIGLDALSGQARAIQDYMRLGIEQTVIADYTSAQEDTVNAATGLEARKSLHPIDSALGDEITRELESFDGGDVWGMGLDLDTYQTVLPARTVSLAMELALEKQGLSPVLGGWRFPVEIITVDEAHYEALCKTAGAPAGSALLLNHYSYNDNGTEVHSVPFTQELSAVTLQAADGASLEIEIGGVLTQERMPAELSYPNTNPVRLILPRAQVRGYTWYAEPSDIPGFIAYADQVLNERFPAGENGDYMEAGFNTRIYQADDYVQVMNVAIVLVLVFLYSFVALLMLIGFTNVISTLSTNVRMRAREFAVLRSVGMTPEGLGKMLNLESVLCAARAMLYGLPIGLLLSWCINLPIRSLFPIPYMLPWRSVLLCAATVLFATWGTTRYAASKLRHQNVIETIRAEDSR